MRLLVLAGATVLLLPAFSAADDIKPFDARLGLWETTSTMEISGMPAMPQIPEDQLAKMPPQQRAQIEAMMKSRGAGGPRTTTTKSCVTKETLSHPLAFNKDEDACTRKIISSSSSRQEFHVVCTREKVTTTGDMTVERIDAEHVKGSMVMKTSGAERPMDMKMGFTSKWLSSDCGDVKPAGAK